MGGTYTPKWQLYLPSDGDTFWGDGIIENFRILDNHMAGTLQELGDVAWGRVPQDFDTIRFDDASKKWVNCARGDVGKQMHSQMGALDQDDHGIYLLLNGSKPMTGTLDMQWHRIINHPDAEQAGDLITKRQFDSQIIVIKNSYYAIDRYLNDPSVILAHQDGDTYIVGPEPIGPWEGHPYALAYWFGGVWAFHEPLFEGTVVYVKDEHTYYRYTGTEWKLHFQLISHSELSDLLLDAHPQYLNVARHRDHALHQIGEGGSVPHDQLSLLSDVTMNLTEITDLDVLVYKAPPTQPEPGAFGYWTNVRRNKVGIQNHNQLWNRLDYSNEKDPEASGTQATPIIIYDPNSPNYDKNAKCHPQYLTDPEHEFNPHSFVRFDDLTRIDTIAYTLPLTNRDVLAYMPDTSGVMKWRNTPLSSLKITHDPSKGEIIDGHIGNPHPQYVPWSTKSGVSIELPGDIEMAGDIRFTQLDGNYMRLYPDIQTGHNNIKIPNVGGTIMVQKEGSSLTNGSVMVANTLNNQIKFEGIPTANQTYVLMSMGPNQFPLFADMRQFYEMLPENAPRWSVTYKGETKWEKLIPPNSLTVSDVNYPTAPPSSKNLKWGDNDSGLLAYNKTEGVHWENKYISTLDEMGAMSLANNDYVTVHDTSAMRDKKISIANLFMTKRTIVLSAASAIFPPGGFGASLHTSVPDNINQVCFPYIKYPTVIDRTPLASDQVASNWFFTMPESWNSAAATHITIYWTPAELYGTAVYRDGDPNQDGAMDTVVWGIKVWRYDEGLDLKSTVEGFTKFTADVVGEEGPFYLRKTIDLNKTPFASGDRGYLVGVSVARLVEDQEDNYPGDVGLLQVRIEYETTTLTD